MRICSSKQDLLSLFHLDKSESQSSFGTDEVYIEKYIPKPRHIEFQILADNYGHIACVGKRECFYTEKTSKINRRGASSKFIQ